MQLYNKKIYTLINIKNWILAFGTELISKSLMKKLFQITSVISINSIEVNLVRGQNKCQINENSYPQNTLFFRDNLKVQI